MKHKTNIAIGPCQSCKKIRKLKKAPKTKHTVHSDIIVCNVCGKVTPRDA